MFLGLVKNSKFCFSREIPISIIIGKKLHKLKQRTVGMSKTSMHENEGIGAVGQVSKPTEQAALDQNKDLLLRNNLEH